MRKIFLFAAAVAVALSSCSKNEVYVDSADAKAIGFGTYVGSATKVEAETAFEANDVFVIDAYYTAQKTMATADTDDIANFMQNQSVKTTDAGKTWTYSPIKYWPNNDGDKVSFFAVTNATATSPITDFDVLDATNHKPSFKITAANTDIMVASVLNQTKSKYAVKFVFKHTMAQVKFTAKLAAALATDTDENDKTEVKITSLTVDYGDDNNVCGGTFEYNINDNTENVGSWTAFTGTKRADDVWNTDAKFGIGTELDTNATAIGEPVMVIPIPNKPYTVTVVYTVVTTDDDSDANNSTIENTCTFNIKPETMNTIYTYNLEISLTKVVVTGSFASDWGNEAGKVEIVASKVDEAPVATSDPKTVE